MCGGGGGAGGGRGTGGGREKGGKREFKDGGGGSEMQNVTPCQITHHQLSAPASKSNTSDFEAGPETQTWKWKRS